ncbi:hypothetical protein LSCM1_05915 [Leishmania martiniquensis]|uniref:Uncharacterized protein n=1 Tax=Leishmania martiniquensis TaxID=1580590 RepID=A0A836HTQ8_9TRYP|nr:hypothetical protein LSCM1_05915 [Leishmania martiniquensis]
MRYRHGNHNFTDRNQHAKALIDSEDLLSTNEQEEVIAYLARSLRGSTQLLKVIVCLQAVLALVHTFLLLSGSLLIDMSVDLAAAASLAQIAQQQDAPALRAAAAAPTALSKASLEALAALDAKQRTAQRKYVHDYMSRRTATGADVRAGSVMAVLSASAMLYSIALLCWSAWSCFEACRRLRVNVEDLTRTEPQDLHSCRVEESPSPAAPAATPRPTLRQLCQRVKADPATAQLVAAALASLSSLFWLASLVHRQRVSQSVYADLGLQPPSVLSLQKITDAALEYVLAVWQPLFHLGTGLLVRSTLGTRANLVALSRLKYRFDKA